MQAFLFDLRHSVRQLTKNPRFTLTAVISLALGIGATTAVFSVVYAILLNPYPYPAADRMARLRMKTKSGQELAVLLTTAQWQTIRKSPVVEDAVAVQGENLILTGSDLPEDINAVFVTSNFFNYCALPAAYGRGLVLSDGVEGQDPQPVAVLSNQFWQRHFGSDPSVVGKTLQLTRKNYTIVGVAPVRFTWDNADVYLPLKMTQDSHVFYVQLGLKKGVTTAQATAALQPLIDEFAKESPRSFPGSGFRFYVELLNDTYVKQLGGTLALLFCAVGLLLAIGCGNVSILLLARATARQHEFAVRAAIGAKRGRIIRQLLTEALLLSVTGAVLGVLLAYRALTTIVKLLPENSYPHQASLHINLPVLLFTITIALITGVLFGLAPALHLSRPEIGQVMQSSMRKIAGSVRGKITNNSLIAAQIALTFVMLAGAGASMEGFLKLLHTPLGYDPQNVMSVGIPVQQGTYKEWAERAAYYEQLRSKAAAVSGVDMAAISSNGTPPSNGWETTIEILGQPHSDDQRARFNFVSPEYFPLLRIPLVEGKVWDQTQNQNGAHVAIINQTMARRYFPNGDALGHSFRVPDLKTPAFTAVVAPDAAGWAEIVGVMADKRNDGLRNPILPEVFLPDTMVMNSWTQILVRSQPGIPPLSLLHSIGKQVSSVNPDQQMQKRVLDLEQRITDMQDYQRDRLIAGVFGALAVLGLALAAVGLYSVVSYLVAQRTSEFGIRMALGAQRGHVVRIVIASTAISVVGGISIGLVLAIALNKVFGQWAEGSARSPHVLFAAMCLLASIAALACFLPARRASTVAPLTALRYE